MRKWSSPCRGSARANRCPDAVRRSLRQQLFVAPPRLARPGLPRRPRNLRSWQQRHSGVGCPRFLPRQTFLPGPVASVVVVVQACRQHWAVVQSSLLVRVPGPAAVQRWEALGLEQSVPPAAPARLAPSRERVLLPSREQAFQTGALVLFRGRPEVWVKLEASVGADKPSLERVPAEPAHSDPGFQARQRAGRSTAQ